jgi:hypothetical protein
VESGTGSGYLPRTPTGLLGVTTRLIENKNKNSFEFCASTLGVVVFG